MVFICSPFRGDTEKNVALAREICRLCAKRGILGIAPHLYLPQFLDDDDPQERAFGIDKGLAFMRFCTEVWVFGKVISEGMAQEITHANKISKPVHFYPDVDVWKQDMERYGKERP